MTQFRNCHSLWKKACDKYWMTAHIVLQFLGIKNFTNSRHIINSPLPPHCDFFVVHSLSWVLIHWWSYAIWGTLCTYFGRFLGVAFSSPCLMCMCITSCFGPSINLFLPGLCFLNYMLNELWVSMAWSWFQKQCKFFAARYSEFVLIYERSKYHKHR